MSQWRSVSFRSRYSSEMADHHHPTPEPRHTAPLRELPGQVLVGDEGDALPPMGSTRKPIEYRGNPLNIQGFDPFLQNNK